MIWCSTSAYLYTTAGRLIALLRFVDQLYEHQLHVIILSFPKPSPVSFNIAFKVFIFNPWFQVHGSRSMVPGPWFQVHGSRSMVPGPWFQVHGSRSMDLGPWFQVHGSRSSENCCFLSGTIYGSTAFQHICGALICVYLLLAHMMHCWTSRQAGR